MSQPVKRAVMQSAQVRPRSSEEDTAASAERDITDVNSLRCYLEDYTRHNPGTVALWCLGVGFILGWKLKPW
jgi:hypothetical protein